jgi:molybdenum cofactor synthesis domain-containing protein
MMIAARHKNLPVHRGDKLAGTRIIPLVIAKEKMEQVKSLVHTPLLEILPYRMKTAGVVATGSEIAKGLIKDSFTPVIREKLVEYGVSLAEHAVCTDDPDEITKQIGSMLDTGVDMVICTGGMSVDPDDRTPLAIKNSGAKIVTYGAPVLPGAMFLLAYQGDRPVLGLPGCVMYSKRTVFDLVLPRLAAGDRITKEELDACGEGGLCLNCPACTFPNCGFAACV